MTHKNVRECCEKCYYNAEMISYPNHPSPEKKVMFVKCSKRGKCPCHQNTQEKKCPSCLAGFSKEDFAGNCTCDYSPPQPPIQEDIADHFEDIEIAILELAQAVEDGAWNGVYKRVYEILRPLTKE